MAIPRPPSGGVPAGLSRFCGRRRELLQLRDLLATERLVTVVGIGGIGKTRLVMELARGVVFDFPDGVRLVELAQIEDAGLVDVTIAEAVSAPRGGQGGALELAAGQLNQGRQLLILDNCEHVLEGAARAAWLLLTQCPGLSVLATSREALNVSGERAWRLQPLRLPEGDGRDDPTGVMSEAVQLFCDRAHLGEGGDDDLPAETVAAVAEICRRLDGLPLALELTAAWVPVLSLTEVAGRLDDSLALLQRDDVGRPVRHRSLSASLDWSHRLLSPPQARAFTRLSVFVGGFSLDAADAILRGEGDDNSVTLSLVAALVNRSLVTADTSADAARYRLLEPVRQYAAEQLRGRPEEESETRRRHLLYHCELAEAAEGPIAGGPDQPSMRRLDAELGNIRAALAWGFAHDHEVASRLATALVMYCWHRRLFDEGLAWARQAGTATGRTRARARLMSGWLAAERGDPEPAALDLDEAYRLTVEGGWSFDTVMVLHAKSVVAYVRGDVDTMSALADEGLERARGSGSDAAVMWALWAPAVCASLRGELRRSHDLFTEALAIAVALDNHSWRSSLMCNVIETAVDLEEYATASLHLREALNTIAVEDPSLVAYLVESAGILAIQQGDHERALLLFGASRAALTRTSYREAPDEAERRRRWVDMARAGADEADAVWQRGLALSAARAVDEARAVVAEAAGVAAEAWGAGVAAAAVTPNALLREGEYWSLTYAGLVARLKNSKGLRDIARIVAAAGRGVAAVDLVGEDHRLPANRVATTPGVRLAVEGDVGETVDAAARAQYRARLVDLEEDITEADAAGDLERASRAREEREFLLAELRSAVGLGGRPRRSLDPAERARKAVSWRVRQTISHIDAVHPALGRHLRRSVRTGSFCVYDPDQPTHWQL